MNRGSILVLLLCAALRAQAATEAVHCEASEGRGVLDDRYMEKLRVCAWRLLEPLTQKTSGIPDANTWTRGEDIIPDEESQIRDGLRPSGELATVRAAKPASEPELYEMTFFNGIAKQFIQAGPDRLDRPATTEALLAKNVREIQFPTGSAALKTFWYHVPRDRSISIRVWDWAATAPRTPAEEKNPQIDVTRLAQRCVADSAKTARKAGRDCLVAGNAFYSITISDQDLFRCARAQCPPLAKGDLLILAAMHIASKQMPEWLWATWWWQGPGISEGAAWTCGAAQRPASIRDAGLWANYAMNVTASFRKERAALAADNPCGAPSPIAGGQELRAMYNPFVEGREENGLKSSCVDCHSRASTKSANELVVPAVDETGGPTLAGFEGHIRLDYLWSIRRTLNKTRTVPRDR
ncbi:MAG: hypothetical protein ABW136_08745 [Steroidobacteraceae bacterium]